MHATQFSSMHGMQIHFLGAGLLLPLMILFRMPMRAGQESNLSLLTRIQAL